MRIPWLAAGFLGALACFGGQGLFPEVHAVRTETAPVIDGELDASWHELTLPYDLGHRDGTTDHLIVENFLTQVRLMWDERNLYVFFVCADTELTASHSERDAPLYEEDVCELVLRFPGDRHVYEIAVSPGNVIYDCRQYWNDLAGRTIDTDFAVAGLESAVSVTEIAENRLVWRVELAVPWAAFPSFEPHPGAVMRGNLLRYEYIQLSALRGAMPYHPDDFLPLCLFPTGIQGWPSGTSSLGRIILADTPEESF